MGGRDSSRQDGGKPADPFAWLVELFRLRVVRNLAVAAVIALGVVAVLYVRYSGDRATPQLPPPVVHAEPELPPVDGTDPTPPPAAPGGFEWAKVIPPPPGMMDNVRFEESGLLDESGRPMMSNTAVVERNGDYIHWVSIMGPDMRTHMYQFKYGCGCPVLTTPDPYRDVVFAEPLKVAEEYRSTMCKSCQELQGHLAERDSTDGSSG